MYQLPDWESGRLSSKDELLVVILQNFFPFADLKNYMQLQVLQAWRGCSEKRASLSWVEVMRSTSPSLCTRLPRNLWSRSQTFARLNNEHGGLGMSFLQIVAVLFFLVYLFFALCLKQTVMEAEGDVSLTCCYCELTAHADAGGTQRQFSGNICSEDDLISRIYGTFVVKFLACLPLAGFSNI